MARASCQKCPYDPGARPQCRRRLAVLALARDVLDSAHDAGRHTREL
jgi:hypothetical protein